MHCKCNFCILQMCGVGFSGSCVVLGCIFVHALVQCCVCLGVLAFSDVHTLVFCIVSWLELSVGVVVDVFALPFCVLLLLATLLCTL